MLDAILKGLGLGLILALSVGPVIFTVIKQSINNGHRGGFSFVAGVWISDIFLVFLSNFFSEWVSDVLKFKQAIGTLGAAFLGVMGIYYIFFKKVDLRGAATEDVREFSSRDFTTIALSGFLINTLNPNVIFFWLINATAFAAIHGLKDRIIIFSVCLLVNILADVAKVMMAGRLRNSLTPRHILLINRISGTILVIFAAVLWYGVVFLDKQGG